MVVSAALGRPLPELNLFCLFFPVTAPVTFAGANVRCRALWFAQESQILPEKPDLREIPNKLTSPC